MIAFASLFLGLVLGVETVELRVGQEVAAVELRLDGEPIGRRDAPPWRLEVDLGTELMPHRLEAVAFDAAGAELDRAVQWLNLPTAPAHASLVIDPGSADGGTPPVAHLAWESLAGADPERVEASFDGQPLLVADPARIELPPFDQRQLHFFRAELVFSENVSSVIEATVGGTYAGRVDTELTAVPVVAARGRKRIGRLASGGRLDGLFVTRGGTPLEVVAAERGAPSAIIVPDFDSRPELERMTLELPGARRLGYADRLRWARGFGRLRTGQQMRILWPVTRRQRGRNSLYELFLTSTAVAGEQAGILHMVHWAPAPQAYSAGRQRLADAVAVAGLESARRRRPRAVVLLLSGDPRDRSALDPGHTRRYLERLNVPLHVWSASRRPGPRAQAWGEIERIDDPVRFEKAVNRLARALERQWMVWIAGTHLPQEIALAPGVDDLEIVR